MKPTLKLYIKVIVFIIVLFILVLGGSSLINKPAEDNFNNAIDSTSPDTNNSNSTENPKNVREEPNFPGEYAIYSSDKLAKAKKGDVVIFFAATWCPTCQALDRSIRENVNDIPTNLSILNANYDTENDLKKKYGVTNQHTLVQVDENGNLLKKWNGSYTIEEIVSQLV